VEDLRRHFDPFEHCCSPAEVAGACAVGCAAAQEALDSTVMPPHSQAHGEAFILIAQVRADTRNSVVRPLADAANDFIKTHIQVLEKTGDVDHTQLPVPAAS